MPRRVFSVCALLLVVLIVMDGILRLSARVSPRVAQALSTAHELAVIEDPILGHRPNPAAPGHDRRGFRNQATEGPVNIVAIGDSNTYGVGVGDAQAWPQQLATLSTWNAYNMGFGGWGPGQYFLVLPEALALKPRVAIVAVYFGNDLYDAFAFAYERETLADFRTTDSELARRIESAESVEPLSERISRTYRMGKSNTAARTAKKTLVDHVYLARFARALRREILLLWQRAKPADRTGDPVQEFANQHPEYCVLYDSGSFRTTFTPEYRLSGLDLEDPRIGEGLNLTCALLDRMAQECQAEDTEFHVLLIPTKEAVFAPWAMADSGAVRLRLAKLVAAEAQAHERITAYLDAHGIDHLDPTESLRECLRDGKNPYRTTADGHPGAAGHLAIARAVRDHLAEG